MSVTEESQPAPQHEHSSHEEQEEDQRLALRRITQRLKQLQSELDRLNHRRDDRRT